MTEINTGNWEKIYQSNLSALKHRYPDIFKKINTTDPITLLKPVKIDPDDKFPDVLIQDGDSSLFYYGHKDPMEYCHNYLSALDLHYAPILVFMGFGLGYQVASALNNLAQKLDIRHIIIIEKDIELFKAAMATMDFSSIIGHPRVEFIVGAKPDQILNSLVAYYMRHADASFYFKSLKIVIMPAVRKAEGIYYQTAVEKLKSSIMFMLQQLGNDPYDSIRGIDYTLKNLNPILKDPWINAFKKAFKGRPAVLVGAGPSLNKDIHLLKEASHKALLVCVDAALKPLLNHGIKPQIVTNIERTEGQSGFFKGLNGLEDTFFVYCSLVYPDTYESYKGPKIISHRYPEIVDWLGFDMDVLTASPTVGNYAFEIAEYLGCDPIIMVGQDLSIPATGATHVEGMVFGTLHRYRNNLTAVDGNNGETLMATRSFIESRKSLEKQIEKYAGRCINACLNGAKIEGAVLMPFRDALNRYCSAPYRFGDHLENIWATEKNGKLHTADENSDLVSRLVRSVSDMHVASKDCKKGIDLISDFEKTAELTVSKVPNPNVINIVRQLEKKVVNIRENIIHHPSLRFLATVFGGYITNFSMRKNYLHDQFHDRNFAAIKALLMEKDALTIMGQLLLSTIDIVQNAVDDLKKNHSAG